MYGITYKAVSKNTGKMISGLLNFADDKYHINREEIIPCTICKEVYPNIENKIYENDMIVIDGNLYTVKFGSINIEDIADPDDVICDNFVITCFYLESSFKKIPLTVDALKRGHYVGNRWMNECELNMTSAEITETINTLLDGGELSPESRMALIKFLRFANHQLAPEVIEKEDMSTYVGHPVFVKNDGKYELTILKKLGDVVEFSDRILYMATYGTEWAMYPYVYKKHLSCWN